MEDKLPFPISLTRYISRGIIFYYKSQLGVIINKNYKPYETDVEQLLILNSYDIINTYNDIVKQTYNGLFDVKLDVRNSGIYLPCLKSHRYWDIELEIDFTLLIDVDAYIEAIICLKAGDLKICENISVDFKKINSIKLTDHIKIDKPTILEFDLVLMRQINNENIYTDININKIKWQVKNSKW